MDKHLLKQLKQELLQAIQPVLERYALEGKPVCKIQESQFGRIGISLETATREGARLRLNGWRFLLMTDDDRQLDVCQKFFFNNSLCKIVDINPRRIDGAPWVIENERGVRSFIATKVLRDCLISAEAKNFSQRQDYLTNGYKTDSVWR